MFNDPWKDKDRKPLERLEDFQKCAERLIAQLTNHLPALDQRVLSALSRAGGALQDAVLEQRAQRHDSASYAPSASKRLEALREEQSWFAKTPSFTVRGPMALCGPLTVEEFELAQKVKGISPHDFLVEHGLPAYPDGAIWAVCTMAEVEEVVIRSFMKGLRTQQKAEIQKKIRQEEATIELLKPPEPPPHPIAPTPPSKDPEIITHDEADALYREFADHEAIGFRTAYSGRGMVGEHCIGFVVDDPADPDLLLILEGVLGQDRAFKLTQSYRKDSMGLSTILYAPGWKIEAGYKAPDDNPEDDENEED